VTAYTTVRLGCDYFNREAERGHKICDESVEAPGTPAQARKAARELGWATGIDSGLGRRFLKDYCLAHKPQETSDGI
jgi:hypothetical protein